MQDCLPGVVNIVTGAGETGAAIVNHPDVDKIAFTGSTEVGRIIQRALAGTGKKYTLELGGKAANIIFADAAIDQAVEGIVNGIFFNQGHVCCAGSRLFVQESVAEEVIRKLKDRMETLIVGDPLDKNTDIGAINSASQLETIQSYLKVGQEEGAVMHQSTCSLPDSGLLVPPDYLHWRCAVESNRAGRDFWSGSGHSDIPHTRRGNDQSQQHAVRPVRWRVDGQRCQDLQDDAENSCGRHLGQYVQQVRSNVAVWRIQGKRSWQRGRAAWSRRIREAGGMTMAGSGTRLPVTKTYKIFIDGKFPRTESGRSFPLLDADGAVIANICRGSRKDFRNAVVAARNAVDGWSAASAYLRGQILYRIAEMLEGRSEQFVAELVLQGVSKRKARKEVEASVDRLIYYAGWSDKYQQIFSAVNPVSSSHFNFSVLEPTGVVSMLAPDNTSLLGLVSNIAPAIVGGNTCVVLASETLPLCAVSFAEVLHASDVPDGVVNILTGLREELTGQFASHMDVNAVVFCDGDVEVARDIQEKAAENIKRVIARVDEDWATETAQSPYLIKETQETKTTWHPIGS